MAARPVLRFAALAAALLAGSCGYSPNPLPGTLVCGQGGSCPEDYACGLGTLCWKTGQQTPTPGTQACGTGNNCPPGYACGTGNTCWLENASPDDLEGCWPFDANSLERVACSDGSSDTTDLHDIDDFIEITAGTASPLTSHYFCPWKLSVNVRSTALDSGQSCTVPDTVSGDAFTYRGEKFVLTALDANHARMEASIPYDYLAAGVNLAGSCTLKITGTLTRADATACVVPVAAPLTEN